MTVIKLDYTSLFQDLIDITESYIADIEVTYKDGSEASFNNGEYKKNTFVNAVLIHVNTVFIMPDEFSIGDITNIIGNVICPSDSSFMFYDVKTYIGDISNWDMLNVTNMTCMFYNCINIPDLSKWDVSNVIDMSYMFYNCLNSDIPQWYDPNINY
jgi:surface protein